MSNLRENAQEQAMLLDRDDTAIQADLVHVTRGFDAQGQFLAVAERDDDFQKTDAGKSARAPVASRLVARFGGRPVSTAPLGRFETADGVDA